MKACSRLAEQAGRGGCVGALLALLPLLCQLVQPLQVHVRSHRIPLQAPADMILMQAVTNKKAWVPLH